MSYKILALDLDGTLTNSRKEISDNTVATLLRLQQQGVKLILASGRPTYGITPLAKILQMESFGGYILSYNGGKIIETKSMEVLYEQILPQEIAPALYSAAHAHGASILSYHNEFIITEDASNKYVKHEQFLTKMKVKEVASFCEYINFAPNKCLIVGDAELLPPLEKELNEKFSGSLNAFRSEEFYLEVVPKGIDKAVSLSRLLEQIGCTPQEMAAAGDGYNDLSMIQLAGFGVAMANAQEEVKAAAKYITDTNDEDGVAKMVEKFLL